MKFEVRLSDQALNFLKKNKGEKLILVSVLLELF